MRELLRNRWVYTGLGGVGWALAGWGWLELQSWLSSRGIRFTLPPVLAALQSLALWPWEQAEGALRLLWDGVQPSRWIAGVLIALLVVPNLIGAWRRAAVMQRLFPPGAHVSHRKELPGELALRYSDLSPYARRVISQEEFGAWRTWNDVADSFQKVPHRIGPSYIEARYHMEPREGWGEAHAFIDFHPLTGQIRQFDIVRDPYVPMVGAQVLGWSRDQVKLEVINR